MSKIQRPIVRWHGGKFTAAPKIIEYFPSHRIYVEPFGGGGSVLLRKNRCYAEIYNDLDGEIVNVFKVMRDQSEELLKKLELTPFSRDEFDSSYEDCDDSIEKARRTIVRSFMGFGSASVTDVKKTGFRSNSSRSGTTPAHDWKNYPKAVIGCIDRLRGVVIENKPAMKVMKQHDTAETLHYVDPPYLHETRVTPGAYRYEMTKDDHIELLNFLKTLKGFVIISGYEHELYDEILGWRKICFDLNASTSAGGAKRREVLWMSPNINSGLFA